MSLLSVFAYLIPFALILAVYLGLRQKAERTNRAMLAESVEAGLTEPASLHPMIDPAKCHGCGACVKACPEGNVLGLIGGKAEMVEAANCIGHGACRTACPFEAITLVFGSATRGVDIPEVGPDFQTNIPGLFIAGELGGMGLIRNAIEQGRQALDTIGRFTQQKRHQELDLIVIGAGPAGLAASLGAKEKGLRFVTLEQETFGGTVAHFPRGKLVMTAPVTLPLVGRMNFREVTKEKLLQFWSNALSSISLPLQYGEKVENIASTGSGFEVFTNSGSYRGAAVLLAIGRRGSPRKLSVPGEELPKVVYRLTDPRQYQGQHVLVVGGGDSALEAAATIADEAGTTVTMSYRKNAFSRAKPKNRKRVDQGHANGCIDVRFNSNVLSITEQHVEIETDGSPETIPNDAIIVCAGGILPTKFLRDIGINVDTKYGSA